MERIAWLPEKTQALIEETSTALEKALGRTLEATLLVGNAMNPARPDRARGPEILAFTEGARAPDLVQLSRSLHDPMMKGARVRVLTHRELDRSCDVFALEISEWKARHLLLSGRDVLAKLTVDAYDLRHGLETELRGLSRRIRNRLLTALATDGRRDDPADAVLVGYDRFLVCSYHALVLLGHTPPRDEPTLVKAVGDKLKVRYSEVVVHLAALRSGEVKIDSIRAFSDLVAMSEPLLEAVDAFETD